jgi:DNA polymerase sigma
MAFVDMTSWIPVDEAKAKIAELIENGTFTKTQIKKSSNLFANRKDKSEGYVCRVLIEAGVHPELEIKKEKKTTKKVKKVEAVAQVTENKPVDNRRYVVVAEPIGEKEGLFLIDQGGKFWVEHQVIGSNEKKIVSPVVDTEADARMLWNTYLPRFKK